MISQKFTKDFFANPKQKISASKENVEKAGANNIFLDWA